MKKLTCIEINELSHMMDYYIRSKNPIEGPLDKTQKVLSDEGYLVETSSANVWKLTDQAFELFDIVDPLLLELYIVERYRSLYCKPRKYTVDQKGITEITQDFIEILEYCSRNLGRPLIDEVHTYIEFTAIPGEHEAKLNILKGKTYIVDLFDLTPSFGKAYEVMNEIK